MHRPTWLDARLYPFKDHWMDLDGHHLHYVDEGPRDAPVLLFAHPGPGWSFTWRHHIAALSDRYRCIAMDQPGHGLSQPAPGCTFTLAEHASTLEAFVQALDLQGITLWANDAGGPTGMLVAGRHPDRFDGFVVGGTFGWDIRAYPKVTGFLRFVTGRGFRWFNRRTNLLAKTQRKMAFGTRKLSKLEGLHYTTPFAHPSSRDRTLLWFRSFVDPAVATELEANLDKLRDKPCLITFGDKDEMYQEGWHERWAKEFPNHDMVTLAGVMHFPFEDAPEETLEAFETWKR